MRYFFLFIFIYVCFSCVDPLSKTTPDLKSNLSDYINSNNSFPLVQDSLIACAAGGLNALSTTEEFPISILFYPERSPSQFLYFESESGDVNPELLDNYWLTELEHEPLFNGFMRKFKRTSTNSDVWGIVSFIRDGKIFISNAIKIKYAEKPSENNPDLISVDSSEELEPIFSWEDGQFPENAIYFQVVSDSENNLISGTYTYEKQFQYYRTENVVLNIKPQNPVQVLIKDQEYKFTLMGVSNDNWVNLGMQKSFIAK